VIVAELSDFQQEMGFRISVPLWLGFQFLFGSKRLRVQVALTVWVARTGLRAVAGAYRPCFGNGRVSAVDEPGLFTTRLVGFEVALLMFCLGF